MSITKASYSLINGAPFNVLDYGADATGVANSTSAFTAAATAAGDQSVFVPKGTYSLTGTVAGNFYSVGGVTISSGSVKIDDLTYQYAGGARDAVAYAGAQSVRVFRDYATMGGFRFRGQYTKGRAPTFAMPANKVASLPTDLGAMSATTFENWYAIFACANDGDSTAVLKLMPFLRAGVVSGSNIPLSRAGEGIYITSTQTYAWTTTNNLANTDILAISENGGFSGRVAKITANSVSQITVDTIGSISEGDYLLPAPPGFDHYVYLACFYEDTAEVRNIYDAGNLVKAKMIPLVYPNVPTGTVSGPPGQTFNCAGYISPLATAIVLDSSCRLSTASTGSYAEYFDGDGSSHILQTGYVYKSISPDSISVVFDNIQVPFLYYQKFNFYNAGTITATRVDGQLNVTGWIEP